MLLPPKPGTKIVGKTNLGALYGGVGIIVGYGGASGQSSAVVYYPEAYLTANWPLQYIAQHYDITNENVWEKGN